MDSIIKRPISKPISAWLPSSPQGISQHRGICDWNGGRGWRPKSLTCSRELISWLWPPCPYSLAPQCWCVSFPGLLSGTQWWRVCHRSEWAVSQASSFSWVPVMQLNKKEVTGIRSCLSHLTDNSSDSTVPQHYLCLLKKFHLKWEETKVSFGTSYHLFIFLGFIFGGKGSTPSNVFFWGGGMLWSCFVLRNHSFQFLENHVRQKFKTRSAKCKASS